MFDFILGLLRKDGLETKIEKARKTARTLNEKYREESEHELFFSNVHEQLVDLEALRVGKVSLVEIGFKAGEIAASIETYARSVENTGLESDLEKLHQTMGKIHLHCAIHDES